MIPCETGPRRELELIHTLGIGCTNSRSPRIYVVTLLSSYFGDHGSNVLIILNGKKKRTFEHFGILVFDELVIEL